jgi:hypothetical protein
VLVTAPPRCAFVLPGPPPSVPGLHTTEPGLAASAPARAKREKERDGVPEGERQEGATLREGEGPPEGESDRGRGVAQEGEMGGRGVTWL